LLPGTYEVKAELTGFKTAIVPVVQVSVDTQTPLTLKLGVGQLTETVEVTGGSPMLKTDRADVSTTFDQRQLTEAPVLDRNFTKFILLTPGAQQLGWQHAASENPQGSTQTMVNGQSFSGTGYQLDGTENRDPILGIIVINPNLEAIGEAKITSQNYDAEFGQARPASSRCRPSRARTTSTAAGSSSSERQVPGSQPLHAAVQGQPAEDQAQPVRLRRGRSDHEEQVVLLRRLPGHPKHRRRLATAVGADGPRAHGGPA
jgi:hypothetical protein